MAESPGGYSEEKTAKTFKCANCAAQMEFAPGAQAQRCPYCGHENPIPASEADIQELDYVTYLRQLDLASAAFQQSDLSYASIVESRLTNANLTAANLTAASFESSTLTGADLSQAHLTRANLSGATLTGAVL